MNEIFVAVKEIDYIEAQIDTLCDKYNCRRGTEDACKDYGTN